MLGVFNPHTTRQPLLTCPPLVDSPAEGPVLTELESKHCLTQLQAAPSSVIP